MDVVERLISKLILSSIVTFHPFDSDQGKRFSLVVLIPNCVSVNFILDRDRNRIFWNGIDDQKPTLVLIIKIGFNFSQIKSFYKMGEPF